MYNLCIDNDWGDPFSYARSREIYMALMLKHTIASTFSGADALEGNVKLIKSTTRLTSMVRTTVLALSLRGTSSLLICTDKISKYLYHFFARFEDGKIVELWQLTSDKVLNLLVPKLKRSTMMKQSKLTPGLVPISLRLKSITTAFN